MSLRLRHKALRVITLIFCLSGPARAHDVQASWTTLRLSPGACELTVRIHAETVQSLIQETAPGASFEPENLDKVMPALKSFGKTLFEVNAGGRTLAATESDASVIFDEVVFNLIYPRTSADTLLLKATHLSKVTPDFTAHVRVTDETGKPLGSHVLRQSQPLVEIPLSSGGTQSGDNAPGSFVPFLKGYDRPLFFIGLLVVLAGVIWFVKRRFF
ncbi:MAG TPA: hypothetical protein VF297_29945 [Pyrinomonadaceae bacterium]